MTATVLLHGGGFDSRCWDLLVPHLVGAVLAVDLPGRGSRPSDLSSVDFAACANSVLSDVDAAGFDEVFLVGHSLAGCSMPSVAAVLSGRVRHAVFIGCTVPEQGRSAFDTLDSEVQEMIRSGGDLEPAAMPARVAKVVLGGDLTEEQFAWCAERLVAEAPSLLEQPVDLTPLRGLSTTWIRTLRDTVVPADKQLRFAGNVGECPVIDVDTGHMCMVSHPAELAAIINEVTRGGLA